MSGESVYSINWTSQFRLSKEGYKIDTSNWIPGIYEICISVKNEGILISSNKKLFIKKSFSSYITGIIYNACTKNNIKNVSIFIDDNYQIISYNGVYKINLISGGTNNLTFKAKGYKDYTIKYEIKELDRHELDVPLFAIDNKPSAAIKYSITEKTNQNVIAYLALMKLYLLKTTMEYIRNHLKKMEHLNLKLQMQVAMILH